MDEKQEIQSLRRALEQANYAPAPTCSKLCSRLLGLAGQPQHVRLRF